jgi:predicted RNA binding protein YcfA (HicA-like mRNA interferase family)
MGKLLSQKSAIKLLREHGWEQSIGGKHSVKIVKPGSGRAVTLPRRKSANYTIGRTRAILRQAGIDPSEL